MPSLALGVNCVMCKYLIPSQMLKELSITQQAIAKYEEDTFSCASDMFVRSGCRDMEVMASDNSFRQDEPRCPLNKERAGQINLTASYLVIMKRQCSFVKEFDDSKSN
jgi:hypothetical protein